MQKNRCCRASAVARGNVLCDGRVKEVEPGDERQLLSSADQRSCRPEPRAVLGASSNSNYESMSAAQQPPHDTLGSDPNVRQSLLAPAEIRSRPRITKASVWFL